MKRRAIAAAGAATLGAATAVLALVAGTTVGYAETTTSSAYGVAAEGALPIDPTPYVESTDGSTKTSSLLELPENPLLAVGAAKLSAGKDKASVELLNVGLLPAAELPEELEPLQDALSQLADALAPVCDAETPTLPELPDNPLSDILDDVFDQLDPSKLCEALEGGLPSVLELGLVRVHCEGDSGGLQLADVTLLGQELPIPEAPENLGIPDNPLLTLTANKQVENEDGSFSVTGLEINLGDGAEIISLGNATCGVSDEDDDDDDDDPTATKPAPVTTGLPVTG